MNNDDQQFESYLREFVPTRPAPLSDVVTAWRRWQRLVAAAVILLAAGVSAWIAYGPPQTRRQQVAHWIQAPLKSEPRQVNLGQLRQFADQPQQLEGVLARASRDELPDFRGKTSSLRLLAKE
jgi:hypothetical protein